MGDGQGLHVVMVPWLAFGHLIPFFHLSTALAKAGFRVSFISTPKNIQRLPKPPHHLFSFVPLPLPHVDGLQPGAEATVDLNTIDASILKKAFDLLRHPFRSFLALHSPDFIIHDVLSSWTAEIALELSVPFAVFSVYSAATVAFSGCLEPEDGLVKGWPVSPSDLTCSPPWIRFPSKVALLPHEADALYTFMLRSNQSGMSDSRRLGTAIRGCEAVALRTCPEYEGEYLDALAKYPKPVIPIGLLPRPTKKEASICSAEWADIFQWLDGQAVGSVVFVGFGSECKLTRDEVYEIAYGLELFNSCFLWALQRPKWARDDGSDALPPGFLSRTAGRGTLHLGWAPQMDILAHPAIGGSLFHAGWGSIIETVQFGHTLVMLPFVFDQGLNARLVVEKGLGLEVERADDGSFRRDSIAQTLRRAMVDKEGEHLRRRSKEMMTIFVDQRLHEQYFSGFVDFLKNFKTK